MVKESYLPSVTQSLQKYIEVADGTSPEELKEKLTAAIVYMLLHDMEKLMGILYRIDVNEQKVKAVFAQNNHQLIAPMLASLIVERELQKAESRQIFRNKQ